MYIWFVLFRCPSYCYSKQSFRLRDTHTLTVVNMDAYCYVYINLI